VITQTCHHWSARAAWGGHCADRGLTITHGVCRGCKLYAGETGTERPLPMQGIPRQPQQPTAHDQALAVARAAVCQTCPKAGKITMTHNGWAVYTVKCGGCSTCSGLSLIRGACPDRRWPEVKS
jgi:hypothetical protein